MQRQSMYDAKVHVKYGQKCNCTMQITDRFLARDNTRIAARKTVSTGRNMARARVNGMLQIHLRCASMDSRVSKIGRQNKRSRIRQTCDKTSRKTEKWSADTCMCLCRRRLGASCTRRCVATGRASASCPRAGDPTTIPKKRAQRLHLHNRA